MARSPVTRSDQSLPGGESRKYSVGVTTGEGGRWSPQVTERDQRWNAWLKKHWLLFIVGEWVVGMVPLAFLIHYTGESVWLFLGLAIPILFLFAFFFRSWIRNPDSMLLKLGKRWPTVGPWLPWKGGRSSETK
jgi:hypothetical protein